MNILACLLVYNRLDLTKLWLDAWQNSIKYANTQFLVVQNKGNSAITKLVKSYNPPNYLLRENIGQDIGALKDVIHNPILPPWDVLFWCLDDNIPMCRDFLSYFVAPFKDDKVGLVGNYWVKGKFYSHTPYTVADHMRTTCFAIRREVAKQLIFPSKLNAKEYCYAFEWADLKMNMTQQVLDMQYTIIPINNDFDICWTRSNDYVWDVSDLNINRVDKRCRVDLWDKYKAQFC